jgi:hypothetical protein
MPVGRGDEENRIRSDFRERRVEAVEGWDLAPPLDVSLDRDGVRVDDPGDYSLPLARYHLGPLVASIAKAYLEEAKDHLSGLNRREQAVASRLDAFERLVDALDRLQEADADVTTLPVSEHVSGKHENAGVAQHCLAEVRCREPRAGDVGVDVERAARMAVGEADRVEGAIVTARRSA